MVVFLFSLVRAGDGVSKGDEQQQHEMAWGKKFEGGGDKGE